MVGNKIEMPVIWDAISPIMTSLYVTEQNNDHCINRLVQDCSNSIANALELANPIIFKARYSDLIWVPWCLKSVATQLFVQQFIQAN